MRTPLQETLWEFRVRYDVYTDDCARKALAALCEATVRINMGWINALLWDVGEYAPCCLENEGVEYMLPQACPGVDLPCQTIRGAEEILISGYGTCIDIACYMAAQLRLRRKHALVFLENMKDGQGRPIAGEYHVILRTARGRVDYTEDLIQGRMASCNIECGGTKFRAIDPALFEAAKILSR
jgi:hypothetical protein